MKRSIFIIILLAIVMLCACTDRLFEDGANTMIVGDSALCRLGLSVGEFEVVGSGDTRATDEEKKATPAEKQIDNIWVFQYDAEGNQILKPKYYESAKCQNEDGSWNVALYVKASTIYVVTNISDSTWAASDGDFDQIDKLKAKSIPSPYPIQVGKGDGLVEADSVLIPMSGSLDVIEGDFASDITVNVVRMYAKLIIKAQMLADMALTAMEVNNIPYTSRIESRSDDPYQTEAASYTSVDFITRAYNTTKDSKTLTASGDSLTQDYVIYVPENIQGVNKNLADDGQTLKGRDYSYDDGCPTQALAVTYRLDIKKDKSDAIVKSTALMFPGANNTNNFNVNRNYVYKVMANFSDKSYFFPTPSSNCFVVEPGKTLTFWPYDRVETGGGYEFRNYLDPTVESKRIAGLKIIWQDYDVIGDNSKYDLVKVSSDGSGYTEYKDIIENYTIDVKTKNEGNALIAAYNSAGDIIWSWHIWVTSLNPDNVGNASRYTTWAWDNSGIKTTEARVPGYQVMPCNLGALAFKPDGSDVRNDYADGGGKLDFSTFKTFGLLYQWGRKDPFPAIKKYKADGNYAFNYNTGNGGETDANIKVYDNSNKLIKMTTNGKVASNNKELFYSVYTNNTDSIEQSNEGGIKYATAHPTAFIAANSSTGSNSKSAYINDGDWLPGHDDRLWGATSKDGATYFEVSQYENGERQNVPRRIYNIYGEKSIFDPCPTGWRVPPGDLWLGFSCTGQNVEDDGDTNLARDMNTTDKTDDIHKNRGYNLYLNGWHNGQTAFFPLQTARVASGQPYWGVYCGNYHNATTDDDNKVNILHLHLNWQRYQCNTFERQRLYFVKAVAGPIRCVRDKK